MSKPTKQQVKTERSHAKVTRVIKQKGYESGKLPQGKELHHVKPVSQGGKTTNANTRVVTATKHQKIHQNRREKGKV
ncbi:MAG: HNH endonuclease signature motif containing protein [Gammaproteobacteria bacterium]